MHPFHERLARVGLAASTQYGLVLAGGYAVQAAGIVDRPSEDIDLFIHSMRLSELREAAATVADAYRADGLTVKNLPVRGDLVRFWVTDPITGSESKVEVCVGWRRQEPITMDVGPVLHPDDAVASKMSALFGRWYARDFIDVDAAVTSGRYSRDDLLALAADQDPGQVPDMFAGAFGEITHLDDDDFAPYGVAGRRLEEMRARFADWRTELLNR